MASDGYFRETREDPVWRADGAEPEVLKIDGRYHDLLFMSLRNPASSERDSVEVHRGALQVRAGQLRR
jgi:hypothetical protein